jgi:hypothetical protein
MRFLGLLQFITGETEDVRVLYLLSVLHLGKLSGVLDGERHGFYLVVTHDSGEFRCGFFADRDGGVAIG